MHQALHQKFAGQRFSRFALLQDRLLCLGKGFVSTKVIVQSIGVVENIKNKIDILFCLLEGQNLLRLILRLRFWEKG